MADNARIYGRKIVLTVGGLSLDDMDCTFKVKKTLKPEPNTLDLEIYNLRQDHRAQLATPVTGTKTIPVRLEAGYEDVGLTQIYFGEARAAWSAIDGESIVTSVTAGDGDKASKARMSAPIGAKAPPEQALTAIAKALGAKPGNINAAVRTLKARGVALFPSDSVIAGRVARELTDFCRAADLEWSIQDGNLQILERGKGTPDRALVLGTDSGLEGSPTVDSKGLVNARVRLIPGLNPGRVVVFDARFTKGSYRIEEAQFTGETAGNAWYADIVCKKW